MAYAGTTSTSPNAPQLRTQSMGSTYGGGSREFLYKSTHTQAEVAATGFITDGFYLGMKVGDRVEVHGSTTYVVSMHAVSTVSTTGATLSAGLLVSSAS